MQIYHLYIMYIMYNNIRYIHYVYNDNFAFICLLTYTLAIMAIIVSSLKVN